MNTPLLVGIPSNRPDRLRTCLLNVFEALKTENVNANVLVCDGSGKTQENQKFATYAAKKYKHVQNVKIVDEKNFQTSQPPAFRFLFNGPYGGPRNAILLDAVSRKSNVVFLDDDVVPAEDFFTRFQTHLDAAHKIVVGAYAGKRTAAVFLMDKVHRALSDFSNKEQSRTDAATKIRDAFCGISDDWPPSEGYAGGCLGVSFQAAQQYCFYPSAFRMEDSLYCILAKHYVEQEAYMPFLPEAPIGVHKPPAGKIDTLVNYYLNALQGACVGKSVKYALETFGKNPTPVQIHQACNEAPKDLLEEFTPARTAKRRQEQKQFDDAINALNDAEIKEQYGRFVNVNLHNVKPTGFEALVQLFFDAQHEWTVLMQKSRNEE